MSSKSLKELSGKWKMNKDLSSDVTPVLEIQGWNALMRNTVPKAPIDLSISQQGEKEIHIDQTTTASIPAIKEEWYPSDNEWREQKDMVLGKVKSRSRWAKVSELSGAEDFLTQDLGREDEIIEAEVQSLEKTEWTARQVWCFEDSKFVRRVVTTGKDGQKAETRLVYDFKG